MLLGERCKRGNCPNFTSRIKSSHSQGCGQKQRSVNELKRDPDILMALKAVGGSAGRHARRDATGKIDSHTHTHTSITRWLRDARTHLAFLIASLQSPS